MKSDIEHRIMEFETLAVVAWRRSVTLRQQKGVVSKSGMRTSSWTFTGDTRDVCGHRKVGINMDYFPCVQNKITFKGDIEQRLLYALKSYFKMQVNTLEIFPTHNQLNSSL